MAKEREKVENNLKGFIDSHLTPLQIREFKTMLSDEFSISERILEEDCRCEPVPAWRQSIWAKELSKYSPVNKEELFPDQTEKELKVKEKSVKEKVK